MAWLLVSQNSNFLYHLMINGFCCIEPPIRMQTLRDEGIYWSRAENADLLVQYVSRWKEKFKFVLEFEYPVSVKNLSLGGLTLISHVISIN